MSFLRTFRIAIGVLAILLLSSCAMIRSDRLCPSPQEDPLFWKLRLGPADQAIAEKWTLAETCGSVNVAGSPPFYFFLDDGSKSGAFCLCPAK